MLEGATSAHVGQQRGLRDLCANASQVEQHTYADENRYRENKSSGRLVWVEISIEVIVRLKLSQFGAMIVTASHTVKRRCCFRLNAVWLMI